MERIGLSGGWLWLKDGNGKRVVDLHADFAGHNDAVKAMFATAIEKQRMPAPDAVGHRVVHGSAKHTVPEIVTPKLIHTLRELIALAPLHLPSEIKGIDAVAAHYPGLSQVVCFDTAFHRRIPKPAQWMPIVRNLWHEGIHRYGFHGLSYEYIVNVLGVRTSGEWLLSPI